MSSRGRLPPLLVVTAPQAGSAVTQIVAAAAAVAPGAVMVQVRAKDLESRALAELTRAVVAAARPLRCPVVVNGRIDVALAADADGVHLPEAGIPVAVARTLLGDAAIVGASTHSADSARNAAVAGADYVVCGPVWDTPSKRGLGTPIGIAELTRAARNAPCPVYAIGGVTDTERVASALAAGAHGVATIRAIMTASDPAAATSMLCRALGC